jgi:hypothetical protein
MKGSWLEQEHWHHPFLNHLQLWALHEGCFVIAVHEICLL